MKVVAQTAAFYNGQRVRPGAVVEVEDGFKALWATPLETAGSKAPKAKDKKAPATLSEMAQDQSKSQTEVLA